MLVRITLFASFVPQPTPRNVLPCDIKMHYTKLRKLKYRKGVELKPTPWDSSFIIQHTTRFDSSGPTHVLVLGCRDGTYWRTCQALSIQPRHFSELRKFRKFGYSSQGRPNVPGNQNRRKIPFHSAIYYSSFLDYYLIVLFRFW